MDGKVSITITTDKPVKIRVMPDDESVTADKEAAGAGRLLKEVKGGSGHVVSKMETRSGGKR